MIKNNIVSCLCILLLMGCSSSANVVTSNSSHEIISPHNLLITIPGGVMEDYSSYQQFFVEDASKCGIPSAEFLILPSSRPSLSLDDDKTADRVIEKIRNAKPDYLLAIQELSAKDGVLIQYSTKLYKIVNPATV